jgi:CRISPR system Cascade subunit CasD
MATLLMCFDGSIQAWGVQSRFDIRETVMEPSKSGVFGLVAAALGRDRSDQINDLADLRLGVRVEREGQMRRDYHTATKWIRDRRTQKWEASFATLSTRFFLADAVFLVGLEGENRQLLEQIDHALEQPHWPLFLGRKACPPGRPIRLENGVVDESLENALANAMWLGRRTASATGRREGQEPERLRTVIEYRGQAMDGLLLQRRPDQPLSFLTREFAMREVMVGFIPNPEPLTQETDNET